MVVYYILPTAEGKEMMMMTIKPRRRYLTVIDFLCIVTGIKIALKQIQTIFNARLEHQSATQQTLKGVSQRI